MHLITHTTRISPIEMSVRIIIVVLLVSTVGVGVQGGAQEQRSYGGRTAAQKSTQDGDREHAVLLVSFDGFRWDYLDRKEATLPNMRRIAEETGVRSEMHNQFITKTFPNHWTLVTGMYEESHGIVSNNFYDPTFDAFFSTRRSAQSEWWDLGAAEPIWITAEKQDVRTATFFWPGSEVAIGGLRPSIYIAYNESVPYIERVDTVLDWLDGKMGRATLAETKPRFVTLYFESPDTEGHKYGPDAPEMVDVLEMCDMLVERLMNGLEERGLRNRTDVIILSDHGMSRQYPDEKNATIYLEDYVSASLFDIVDYSPVVALKPRVTSSAANATQQVAREIFESLHGKHPNMSVYHRRGSIGSDMDTPELGLMPERFHYEDNDRIMPVLAVADTGWLIEHTRNDTFKRPKGEHGFDPKSREMRPFFLATGPSFKRGAGTFEMFDNVDMYPLMCTLLNITPSPNNGSLSSNVVDMLIAPPPVDILPPKMEAADDDDDDDDEGSVSTTSDSNATTGSGKGVAGFIGFFFGIVVAALIVFLLYAKFGKIRFGKSSRVAMSAFDDVKDNPLQSVPLSPVESIEF